MATDPEKIAAVVVTYHPDIAVLDRLLQRISPQVQRIWVVDNTPGGFDTAETLAGYSDLSLMRMGTNTGVAAAQNVGIEAAREQAFSHVLLLDQDSLPAADMVGILITYLDRAEREGIRVGAIGPRLRDARTNRPRPFVRTRNGMLRPVIRAEREWTMCDFLVSSGTLIPIDVFGSVGLMEEALFIDCVDVEWGYRAGSRGLACIGAFEAGLTHTQGQTVFNILGFHQSVHAPVRHYFFFRNSFELLKRGYIAPSWKRHVVFRAPFYAVLGPLISASRMQSFKMVVKGIFDGLRGELGPIS